MFSSFRFFLLICLPYKIWLVNKIQFNLQTFRYILHKYKHVREISLNQSDISHNTYCISEYMAQHLQNLRCKKADVTYWLIMTGSVVPPLLLTLILLYRAFSNTPNYKMNNKSICADIKSTSVSEKHPKLQYFDCIWN